MFIYTELGDIIEIESSPEPPTPAKSRDKGKRKATPYRVGLASSVIELTDSESEVDDAKSSTTRRLIPSHSNVLTGSGPSSQKRTPISNLTLNTPRSSGHIPTPSHQNGVSAPGSGFGAASSSATASGSGTNASPAKQNPTPSSTHGKSLQSEAEHDPAAPFSTTTCIEPVQQVGLTDEAPPSIIEREPTIPIPDQQPQIPTRPTTPDLDPTTIAVAQILEIIPNIEPTHLLELIETHLPTFSVFPGNHQHDADGQDGAAVAEEREATVEERVQGVVGHILHLLFENPDYPKADLRARRKGKGRRVDEPDDQDDSGCKGKGKAKEIVPKKPRIDYASIDRPFPGGPNYFDSALYHLQMSFPHIPKPYLRRQLQINKSLYAPTHLSVLAAEKTFDEKIQHKRPYAIKSSRVIPRKPQGDAAFEEEKAWLDAELTGGGNGSAEEVDETINNVNEDAVMNDAGNAEDDGGGIECQCCFAEYPFSQMVQCPETHLFCSTCISTYAATQLGAHNSSLTCIHPSSCSLPFPPSELKRILSVKLYELYERLEQQKEIMEAGLVGLEECPFCEWKCVLEASTEEDKLFRCGNEEGGCGIVSCRGCKKLDHLPKSCKEVEEDRHLDGRHAIEEAMTRALMRNCPKCQKAFIKEYGCNKMICSNCQTLSCYICRRVITGYDHFDSQPGRSSTSTEAKKCALWDAVEERHAQEVKEAAEKAMEEYKRDHPDIDEWAIKVDLPKAPPKNAAAQPRVAPGVMYPFMGHAQHNPNANPIAGNAHAYPHLLPALLPQPPRVHVRRLQQAAHHRQAAPQQPLPAPNTRARAAAVQEQQRQAQQQRHAKANTRAERARLAEQVRFTEEENRARQRLDRVRDQRAIARREQQERAQLAMEMERQRQRQRQPQVQVQLQGPAQAHGQAHQDPYHQHYHRHVHHHQQAPQPQPPIQHLPALQNPFALGGINQQEPMMVPPPQVAKDRGRRRR